jgi:deoxyribodipyrimidine photo-lyase
LRTLAILQRELALLDIPLHIETVEPRRGIPAKVVELMKTWNATELFANIEYEVDELERDQNLLKEVEGTEIRITYSHDQCVVEPDTIFSGVWIFLCTLIVGGETNVGIYPLVSEMDCQSSR